MTPRNTVNLALLAGVMLAAGVAWSLRTPAPPAPRPWIDADASAVKRILVARHARAVLELERRQGDWWLLRPFSRPAASARVTHLLGILRGSAADAYRADAIDLQGAGLAAPEWRIEFDLLTVELGALEVIGNRRYARNGDRVVLLPDQWQPLLEAGAPALADLRLWPSAEPLRSVATPLARIDRDAAGWAAVKATPEAAAAMAQAWVDAVAGGIQAVLDGPLIGEVVVRGEAGGEVKFLLREASYGLALQPAGQNYQLAVDSELADRLLQLPGAD